MKITKHNLLFFFSILGLIFSSYLVYLHYTPVELQASFCNLNDYFSCATVNTSTYSYFLGVPVAIIGALGFLVNILLLLFRPKYYEVLVFCSYLIALLFMFYLTIAELFFIHAVCVLCVSTAIIVLILFFLSFSLFKEDVFTFLKEIKLE